MAIWEYKVVTSGPHGFASPALLETHLNSLGKDEWEIIHFQTLPNNPLAFHGLARRSTMRDWTPPAIAAAPAAPPKVSEPAPTAKPAVIDERPELPAAVAAEVAPAPSTADSLRTVRDTERDQDPDAPDEDDWDNWKEDELPTFFEAIKPLLRRNQKGPGQSAPIEHLARRWELKESDIIGALKECGLTIPETEEQEPEYFEFEGDLYWVNRNARGQLFINSREKPRPVFRTAPATKLSPDDPAAIELAAEKAEIEKRNKERAERQAAAEAAREAARAARQQREAEQAARAAEKAAEAQPAEPLPEGAEILEKIRPHMRRNRRGPGYSGSLSFLARALNQSEADLAAAFAKLGLQPPENGGEKPTFVEIGRAVYWINKDNRGGVWINGREKRDGDRGSSAPAADAAEVPAREAAPGPAAAGSLEDDKPAEAANVAPTTDAGSSETAAATAAPEPPDATSEQADAAQLSSEQPKAEPSAENAAPAGSDDAASTEETATDEPAGRSASGDQPALAAVRLLLKPNKRGSGVSGEVGFLARSLDKEVDAFLGTLTAAGLVVPADSETKPVFVEHAGEIFWLNQNAKDGSLWLNAKAAKSAAKKSAGSKPRARKPKSAEKEKSAE